jgi:general secretion pathway protein B
MSFILDALRKSEHERQRSEVPGLSQVPLAAPQPKLPRWASAVIGVLAAAVLALGGAWWQSARLPADGEAAAPTVERSIELPPASTRSAASPQAAPSRPLPQGAGGDSLATAAGPSSDAVDTVASAGAASQAGDAPADAQSLPSAAALAAEGIALPTLRLELHAFNAQPRDRFVFINGRKYVEGERLTEGPQLVTIEPTGAVLTHSGRRFMLVQE